MVRRFLVVSRSAYHCMNVACLQDRQGSQDLAASKDRPDPQEVREIQDLPAFRVVKALRDSQVNLEVQVFKDHRDRPGHSAPQVHSCLIELMEMSIRSCANLFVSLINLQIMPCTTSVRRFVPD